ncbi:retrovirus-related pol polyprotein from transposon TNT 1-94 [Tanacetum coccineum]
MDDMIREKLALKEQVDSLEQNLSKQIKEKECLLQTFTVFKSESKEKEDKYMENEIDLEKKIKELDNILFKVGQSAQTVHMLTKPQAFYDNIHKQALGYQNPFHLKKAQRIKPTLYDGIVMSDKHVAMPVIDDEETLILEEESRSKMSEKAKDPEVINKNISHKPIDYEKLNRLTEDFGKRFTPQQELSAEQAFWLRMSDPTSKPSDALPVKIEAPKELPKISLVNESLKKLKFHLAKFDNVVKIRTTPNARTEGEWGFKHTKAVFNNENIPFLKSLKDIFNVFDRDILNEIMEELLLENDRLLQQIMSQDVLLTVMNSMSLIGETMNMNGNRKESCNLKAELLKSQNAFNDILKRHSKLEKHYISLECSIQLNQEIFQKHESCDNQNALEILDFFENNDLKAQLQDKDSTICKLKDIIKSLREKSKDENVKYEYCDTETKNVELENSVAKLLSENERLCNEINHVKQEQADTLWGIVKQAKAKQPLDKELDFACKHAQRIQELLVYVRDTCPNAIILSAKKVAVTPKNKIKKVGFAESLTSSRNIKQCGSKPTGNKKNDKISQPSNRNMKNKVEAQPKKVNKKHCVVKPIHDVDVKHSLLNVNSEPICATFRFGNDHIARIMGYGDYQLGNVTISRVYYVEGLGHNLFFVGQFCDADLEVAFWKNTCFIRNLEGVDLLSGSRDTNLYTISLDDMLKTSPICLLSKASKTKSWLWHRRLSHLNFGTLNKLAKDGLARGIPRLKFQKDHLCSACALGKSKKSSHQPKAEDTNQEKLYLLHMDLCGPMRVASINGKRYILVIVDDYSRFTWVRFLRTKDEAPEAIIKYIKNIEVRLNATIRNVRTDYGTEFVNQTLREFYENVGISHQTSVARTPQQNSVLITLASKQFSSRPGLHSMTPATSSSGLVPNPISQQRCIPPQRDEWHLLFQPMFDEYFTPLPITVTPVQEVAASSAVVLVDSPMSTSIDQDAPSLSTPSTQEQEESPNIS